MARELVDDPTPETQPMLAPRAPLSSSTSADEGRFPAGTVLAGRYRIFGLLGRGGMGEVYRAHDLILNQAVALKFLAVRGLNNAALERFRNEVRVARQVSHPNVCRVHDVGVVEGLHFLSMEYLDGEDLSSLLRRIGRLPQDKATEFARKICAGLAAAHDRGVLHRDLKPSNIMIDGRGHVKITDFGLAAIEAEIPLSDLRSGTPAYMSPEQKAGKEVTVRSDLYSLGLVLHEMFTGQKRSAPGASSPTEIVRDLDPAIERLILRCLEEDPKRRPASAIQVARMLPGGDPIAAALAAGETPSPEMVAASEEKEGFSKKTALWMFVAALVIAAGALHFIRDVSLTGAAPLPIPPDGLAYRAQDILHQLGYNDPPKRVLYGFDCCDEANGEALKRYPPEKRRQLFAEHRPPLQRFWYRQHTAEMHVDSFDGYLFLTDIASYETPPNTEPGMMRLHLDPKGRLVSLEVRPDSSRVAEEVDWSKLFQVAGLDATRFAETTPTDIPPVIADERAAWTGTYSADVSDLVRVEAARWKGRPVYFRVGFDTVSTKAQTPAAQTASSVLWIQTSGALIAVVLLICTAFVARSNLKRGRGDRKGAAILVTLAFTMPIVAWAVSVNHVPEFWELHLLVKGVSWAVFLGAFFGMLYLAVEPYIRSTTPDALIGWSRLLAGRSRDPQVASEVLLGAAWAAVGGWVLWLAPLVMLYRSRGPASSMTYAPYPLSGLGEAVASALSLFSFSMVTGLSIILLLSLLQFLTRRFWIAALVSPVIVNLFTMANGFNIQDPVTTVALTFANLGLMLGLPWLLRRGGLLSLLVATSCMTWIFPAENWYVGRGLFSMLQFVVPAAWATWVIVSAPERRGVSTESTS